MLPQNEYSRQKFMKININKVNVRLTIYNQDKNDKTNTSK